jgi:hypothetical protein
MSVSYEVIVSSENSLFMGWQTKLFCFSAESVLKQRPIVVVHGTGEPLRPEFRILQERGFKVVQAPSFAIAPSGVEYKPRNELGTLLEVASMSDLSAEHILFCEPDMIFVHRLEYSGSLAAEYYNYLQYAEPRVANAASKFGLGHLIDRLNETRGIGVPYLIPVRYVKRLALRWIEVLDAFEELQWIDIMYAFGIATMIEGLDVEVTHIMATNNRNTNPLRGLIHYCYGDRICNKHSFRDNSPFDIPDEIARPDTVLGEIVRQLWQARAYFAEKPNSSR